MLPLLGLVADGKEREMREVVEGLANQFRLTSQEQEQLQPSGVQRLFSNRVHWARLYLKNAGLLNSPNRGKIIITQAGLSVLKERPATIDLQFLRRYPSFVEFLRRTRRADTEPLGKTEQPLAEEQVDTPEEALDRNYHSLRRALSQELLDMVRKCSPQFFERLVVDLLVAMGYGGSRKDAAQAVGRSGDEGIDGIIKEDKLGLDTVYIQAKRWENPVGRPVVQGFAGSLEGHRARKGVLITTSHFSKDALDYVGHIEKKIVLIDGEQLSRLMIDYGIGVAEVTRYEIKKIDLDYFGEE